MPLTPETFRALAVARALDFYSKTGIQVNTAYTPRNMLRTAPIITGQKFRPNQMPEAAKALRAFVEQRLARESLQ